MRQFEFSSIAGAGMSTVSVIVVSSSVFSRSSHGANGALRGGPDVSRAPVGDFEWRFAHSFS